MAKGKGNADPSSLDLWNEMNKKILLEDSDDSDDARSGKSMLYLGFRLPLAPSYFGSECIHSGPGRAGMRTRPDREGTGRRDDRPDGQSLQVVGFFLSVFIFSSHNCVG